MSRHLICWPQRLGLFLLLGLLVSWTPGSIRSSAVGSQEEEQAPISEPDDASATSLFPNKNFQHVAFIQLHGEINPQLKAFFSRKLERARLAGADTVVIDVDSPGGGLEESLFIAESLRDVDWASTISFIPERALSGAALISLGCDRIVMSPTARIGDAGVIFLDETFMFRYAPEKYMTDLVRRARDLSEANGYPPDLAEAMIDRLAVVYERQNAEPDSPRFRIERAPDPNINPDAAMPPRELEDGQWIQVEESNWNRFLEVNGSRAVELTLASANAADRSELLRLLGSPKRVTEYKSGTVDAVVYWLNRPFVTGLIFVIGLVAIYFEFSAPGVSVGGLIGGLCFALFFWSRFLGGTAAWLEVLLFCAGVIFLLVEIFVIPGTGLSGLLGLALIIVSIVMASQSFVIPRTSVEAWGLTKSLGVVFASGAAFLVAISILSRYVEFVPVLNKFVLSAPKEPSADRADQQLVLSSNKSKNNDVSIGDFGVAESVLRPSGKARFAQATLDVVADGAFVELGQTVQVVQISGNRIVVRAAAEA